MMTAEQFARDFGKCEYERDKYKSALERIARENPPHQREGWGLSEFGGNADDMADDAVRAVCGRIGNIARVALGQVASRSEG